VGRREEKRREGKYVKEEKWVVEQEKWLRRNHMNVVLSGGEDKQVGGSLSCLSRFFAFTFKNRELGHWFGTASSIQFQHKIGNFKVKLICFFFYG